MSEVNERPEVECPLCSGEGMILESWDASGSFNQSQAAIDDCPDCHGTGWRPATQEELDDMAADAFSDMCEREPPLSLDEQCERAWELKRELRR